MVQVTKTVSIQNHVGTISNFMNAGGRFLVLSRDEQKFRLFRNTLSTGIKDTRINCAWMNHVETPLILEEIADYIENSQDIFLIMDEKRLKDYGILEDIRGRFAKDQVPVLVFTQEIGEPQINYFLEIGANNILVVPYSPVNLIEKISFTLKPGQLGQIIEKGRELSSNSKYQEALAVCDVILKHKPGSAAALMLKGDVFLARAQSAAAEACAADRKAALDCYARAWNANRKYLEPLKRLADACKSEVNSEDYLNYLKELDKLSPLILERKMEIGKIILASGGDMEEASQYFEGAVNLLKQDAETPAEQIRNLKNTIRALLKDRAP